MQGDVPVDQHETGQRPFAVRLRNFCARTPVALGPIWSILLEVKAGNIGSNSASSRGIRLISFERLLLFHGQETREICAIRPNCM